MKRSGKKWGGLEGFEAREVTLLNQSKTVFIAGSGPAVIVMCEIPGITPELIRFAHWVREAGFTIFMPHLIGEPGKPVSRVYGAMSVASLCVRREFAALASNRASPVTLWLRALAAHAWPLCGGQGVGAVGMCLTGNFALSMMLEPSVRAPVISQPSMPPGVLMPRGLHIAPDDLKQVKERLEREDLNVLAYRFEGDIQCPAARFKALEEALGDRVVTRTLPNSASSRDAVIRNHGVLTLNLIDEAHQPTRQAVDEIIALFRERLI